MTTTAIPTTSYWALKHLPTSTLYVVQGTKTPKLYATERAAKGAKNGWMFGHGHNAADYAIVEVKLKEV